MNLLMVTNTYPPFVGGVARSVQSFTEEFRRLGHRVVVVAPSFPGVPKGEKGVIRVPAIQRFNGSDFSVGLPIPGFLFPALETFRPDIVHSHHPYLLGDMALRISASRNAPLVFTHHTMYEMLAHYVLGDSPAVRRFIVDLSTGYANLCDRVIAPSASTARILLERGVKAPIAVIPTGVDMARFRDGNGTAFRASMGIPPEAFVVGHAGRLGPEKNLGFLIEAVIAFLAVNASARFLVVGVGPSMKEIRERFGRSGAAGRLHCAGILRGEKLADAYRAMDVFAFASRCETQGMVLNEAMASGVPVVAVDAPGVREAVIDGRNGYLLPALSVPDFSEALSRAASLSPGELRAMGEAARGTAARFSIQRCAGEALALYETMRATGRRTTAPEGNPWAFARRMFERERTLWRNRAHAVAAALSDPGSRGDCGGRARRGRKEACSASGSAGVLGRHAPHKAIHAWVKKKTSGQRSKA
jgi:glycosyltransferase involved in cell wall biosynthesis